MVSPILAMLVDALLNDYTNLVSWEQIYRVSDTCPWIVLEPALAWIAVRHGVIRRPLPDTMQVLQRWS